MGFYPTSFLRFMDNKKIYNIKITNELVNNYCDIYFKAHPRAKKKPVSRPVHPSINSYYNLSRMAYNTLKQKWKQFSVWLIEQYGLTGKNIKKCKIQFNTYYKTSHRRDLDNLSPKFIFDGFVESEFIIDDSCLCIEELTIKCYTKQPEEYSEFIVEVLE